jgi:arylsulfate sulfotransferase
MIIDLDLNLQVAWTWNTFDHLDVSRKAVLNEQCSPFMPICPPIFKSRYANDWTHANAIDYVPADGSLLVSLRHQDWVVKIDYGDGAGTGEVIWRLGRDGDFPDPPGLDSWFSHQHDAHFEGDQLLIFDNGNTRCGQLGSPGCNSRGQALVINEEQRTVSVVLSADLGVFAPAVGSAQRLSNGNYWFTAGMPLPDLAAVSTEVRADGTPVYRVAVTSPPRTTGYRSFRLADLYTPAQFSQDETNQ